MKVFLAGTSTREYIFKDHVYRDLFILESFIYMANWMLPLICNNNNFLLDSGAFSFLAKSKDSNIDWDAYIDKYAAFINEYDIVNFFELDIDPIIGLQNVELLRARLEQKTQKKCIPVWHKSRGLAYWEWMCQNYEYVAIGGIVTKEIKPAQYGIFTILLNIASKYNTKVHGLGFTYIPLLRQYKFYSVDSTTWVYGNISGFLYKLRPDYTDFDKIKPKNVRGKSKPIATHNFNEWVKFQKYAAKNL